MPCRVLEFLPLCAGSWKGFATTFGGATPTKKKKESTGRVGTFSARVKKRVVWGLGV